MDPVTAYDQPILAFNRYAYAANNPYKFVDPDGRNPLLTRAIAAIAVKRAIAGATIDVAFQMAMGARTWDDLNKSDIAVAAAAGVILPGSFTEAKAAARSGKTLRARLRAYRCVAEQCPQSVSKARKLSRRLNRIGGEIMASGNQTASSVGVIIVVAAVKELSKDTADSMENEEPQRRQNDEQSRRNEGRSDDDRQGDASSLRFERGLKP